MYVCSHKSLKHHRNGTQWKYEYSAYLWQNESINLSVPVQTTLFFIHVKLGGSSSIWFIAYLADQTFCELNNELHIKWVHDIQRLVLFLYRSAHQLSVPSYQQYFIDSYSNVGQDSLKYTHFFMGFLSFLEGKHVPAWQCHCATVHNASSMKTWSAKVKVQELMWPAQRRYLNPTEHLWGILKCRLHISSPHLISVSSVTNALMAELPTILTATLVESLNRNVEVVNVKWNVYHTHVGVMIR